MIEMQFSQILKYVTMTGCDIMKYTSSNPFTLLSSTPTSRYRGTHKNGFQLTEISGKSWTIHLVNGIMQRGYMNSDGKVDTNDLICSWRSI
jgi:hypothetical protein